MAVQNGDDEIIAELLDEFPDLSMECDDKSTTALHYAAKGGHDKVVARLLDACPTLINVKTAFPHRNALHFAAEEGHDKVVARLLAAGPHLAKVSTSNGMSALHFAAYGGNHKVVTQLLAASPSLITSIDNSSWTALAFAAVCGHEKVFTQLLTACPQLLERDDAVLHCAAENGHDGIVAQIVALCPGKIAVVNADGWTALKSAIFYGHQRVAERLLAIRPDEVYDTYPSLLHIATRECSFEFVAKLWRMNPQALRAVWLDNTPFDWAILHERNDLIGLFQWSLSFDEIVCAFIRHELGFETRYRPVMDTLCEPLWGSLNQDVMGTVFEYLGFGPPKRRETRDMSWEYDREDFLFPDDFE